MAQADDAELQVELEAGSGLSADDCTVRFKFILAAIDRFLKRLAKNSFLVPYHVRVAFSQLHASVTAKFSHVDAITSCTSLFFLRIFSPAILNPSLYGVFSSSLRPAALRALLLVSRILQSSANGQPPSSPFSNIINLNVIANVAIERYTPQLRSFMQSVIDPGAIAGLEKVQTPPLHSQIKRLKRTALRTAREELDPAQADALTKNTSSGIVATKGTKSRSGSHPVMPLTHSSPSKASKKKAKSKTAVRVDSSSIGGNRARALTSHDVFFQPDDTTSNTSTPPASPRPTISFAIPNHTPSAPAITLPQQSDNASPSKRNIRLKLGSEELEETLNQRAGADGVSWLVSPRRSAVNSTAEAKRKRLVNRLSTMLPKKSVLDEFDSMKQPS